MSVSVVTCVYGDYHRFYARWWESVHKLDPKPDAVIVAADRHVSVGSPDFSLAIPCSWDHPQAFYLQTAINAAATDWVWISDVDDLPHPDALAGLEDVDADVWQMGFDRSDGEVYVVPQLTNSEYLASHRNVYVGTSAVRTRAFHRVGGFPDVALQDWALWRRLAADGARFKSSGRTHFHYNRHSDTREATELTQDVRALHLAQMMDTEAVLVAT